MLEGGTEKLGNEADLASQGSSDNYSEDPLLKARIQAEEAEGQSEAEFDREEALATQESVEYAQQEVKRLIRNLSQIRENYPNIYDQITAEIPGLEGALGSLGGMLENSRLLEMSYEEIQGFRQQYNSLIAPIEAFFFNMRMAAKGESSQDALVRAGKEKLTLEEERELKRYADVIWGELFPPSQLKEAVMAFNGREESDGKASLEEWQEYALVPGMAIEKGVNFFLSLKDPETYQEMKSGFDTLKNISYQDWMDVMQLLKTAYGNAEGKDVAISGMTLLLSLAFIGGGIGKMGSVLKRLGASERMLALATKASHRAGSLVRARGYANALPVGVVGGMALSRI